MKKIFTLFLFLTCNYTYSQVSILNGQDTTRRPIVTSSSIFRG